MKKMLLAIGLIVVLSGCIDDRVKRAGNLLDVKTSVAADEFNAAANDADKVKVAKEYFSNAPQMAKTLNQYLHGVNPDETQPVVPPTVTVPIK